MRSSSLPPRPDRADGKPALNRPMECKTEHAFLKVLIAHDSSEESCQLQHNLTQTERDEKCIRRAVFVVVILLMLSAAGLAYCALLQPEALWEYHLLQSLCGLGLGSLVSLVVFLGYWFWKRAGASRLHGECRLRVLSKFRFRGDAVSTRVADLSGATPGGSLDHQPIVRPE